MGRFGGQARARLGGASRSEAKTLGAVTDTAAIVVRASHFERAAARSRRKETREQLRSTLFAAAWDSSQCLLPQQSRCCPLYLEFSSRLSIIVRVKSNVNRTGGSRRDLWIAGGLFLAALALYLRTMPPTVLDGDSGEYQYMAYILGVPHSPGSPLFVLLGKLFTFLPLGDVAYRVNLFCAVIAAFTAPVVYWTMRRLVENRAAAVVATVIFALAPTMWGGAVEAKTYSLHLFLGVLAIFLVLRWHQDGQPRDFNSLAFVYGLGLANHPMIRFIAPALVLALWVHRSRLNRAILLRGAALLCLPLLLYAYIPIRANQLIAQQNPANLQLYGREDAILKGTVNAYYLNSVEGFFNLTTGLDNVFKLEFKTSVNSSDRYRLAALLLQQQFGIVGIVLAAVGAVISFKRDRQAFLILLVAALGVGIIALILHGISTTFYFSLTYFVLALWIGLGIEALLQWARRVHASSRAAFVGACSSPVAVISVLSLLPLASLVNNFPLLDESGDYAPRDYAQTVLHDNLAQNAVVIAPWEVSQPIRYFQFVENQRPDLLVVNVSPVQPQFWTMLANARKLGRPFYMVEFDPETKTGTGDRTVQAIPLPLDQPPKPRYPLQNAQILDQVQVLGYDLDPDPPQPGRPARVTIYYRAKARMYPMYSASLSVSDVLGRPWEDYLGFPVSFYIPTYRWYELGEYYRDVWTIDLPSNAPAGLYNLNLSWYVYDLETRQSDPSKEYRVSLGTIRAGDWSVPPIAHPQNLAIGNSIRFLGWNTPFPLVADAISVHRGDKIDLDLFWRAERQVAQAYTVFVHLAGADGHVFADADSPPFNGLFPTNLWKTGETIRDRHVVSVPGDLTPGKYTIEIGLYDPVTGKRLPMQTANGVIDKWIAAQVNVR